MNVLKKVYQIEKTCKILQIILIGCLLSLGDCKDWWFVEFYQRFLGNRYIFLLPVLYI